MNYDELAFFNQQLAVMLRDGIPLEGALKQLCAGMNDATLRKELTRLEEDLARGIPLKEALSRRQLPAFYVRMVEIGACANDLPGMLTLLADYYQRVNAVWIRLKGLMVYPLIVIGVSLLLALVLSLTFHHFLTEFMTSLGTPSFMAIASIWVPPVLLALIGVAGTMAVTLPSWRARLRWRLPAFREASLAQFASAMALMLKNGTPFPEALALAEAAEGNNPAGRALAEWRHLVESGMGKPEQWPSLPPFPPMFLWLVQKGGEDLATGFQKAADIYQARASHRIELALYGLLPVSVLLLGQMIFWQVTPLIRILTVAIKRLSDF